MTSRLDRLTTRQLVTRRSDASDGRLVRVRLTAAGRQAVDDALATLLDSERELLRVLAVPDREAVASALRTLLLAAQPAPAQPSRPRTRRPA